MVCKKVARDCDLGCWEVAGGGRGEGGGRRREVGGKRVHVCVCVWGGEGGVKGAGEAYRRCSTDP